MVGKPFRQKNKLFLTYTVVWSVCDVYVALKNTIFMCVFF